MNLFTSEVNGQTVLRAMPLLLGVLCCLAIAYRWYSAFLAARVAMLDDLRKTPAHEFNDGQNYHPTNKWVLFGHHFAAISGAGPLIGPVLAIQYGYMPGLLWLLVGVCLAGAVQDMLVLAASVRRGGKSLAQIARTELGRPASIIVSLGILFIVVIALAGLGFVVVKALGGEEVKLPKGMEILVAIGREAKKHEYGNATFLEFPEGCQIRFSGKDAWFLRPEKFAVKQVVDPKQDGVRFIETVPDGVAAAFIRLGTSNAIMVSETPGGTNSSSLPVARKSSQAVRGARSPLPARYRSRCSSASGCIASARGASPKRRPSGPSAS